MVEEGEDIQLNPNNRNKGVVWVTVEEGGGGRERSEGVRGW